MKSSSWYDHRKSDQDFVETPWAPKLKGAEKVRRARIRQALDEIQERRALAQQINDPLFPGDQHV